MYSGPKVRSVTVAVMFCEGGVAPPIVASNNTEVGATEIAGRGGLLPPLLLELLELLELLLLEPLPPPPPPPPPQATSVIDAMTSADCARARGNVKRMS